jgi:hypothetical protein
LVLTPEALVGQWITLPGGQVARVKRAYYGYLTRSGKDSIDLRAADGKRGIVLEMAFINRYQTREGDILRVAPTKKVMRLRRAWWAVWFAMGSVPFTLGIAMAYILMTPNFFFLEGSERFVYIGIFGIAITVTAAFAGAFGSLLPRKPPGPAGAGIKNAKRM